MFWKDSSIFLFQHQKICSRWKFQIKCNQNDIVKIWKFQNHLKHSFKTKLFNTLVAAAQFPSEATVAIVLKSNLQFIFLYFNFTRFVQTENCLKNKNFKIIWSTVSKRNFLGYSTQWTNWYIGVIGLPVVELELVPPLSDLIVSNLS